ncbi:BTAD domain-containing putative transcriptional regulator [Amycolatopsis sp. NPDC051071]|uniref:BTAD domain-containing putative transcriptional regulator n=1 Tax=Amycolatopsis sp. NPDC051071 TaxID=3154637 RepID=UPI0034310334
MEFLALGPLEVRTGRGAIPLGGPRQRAVLARLLIAAGTVVPVETLVADLWPTRPPPSAVAGLHAYVSNLRRVLEPERGPREPPRLLVRRAPGYLLQPPDGSVDVARFENAVDAAAASLAHGVPEEAVRLLDAALATWRGAPYADLADEHWIAPELGRLTELKLFAKELWAEAELALGRAWSVIPVLTETTAEAPLRESLWRHLALALYRCGRQGEALAVLRRLSTRLRDDLGVDPSPAVRRLETALLDQSAELGEPPVVPRPRRAPDARPIGRTTPFNRLVEAARAVDRSGRPQLVIVDGEPGIGKTYLAETFAEHCRALGWLVGRGTAHEDGAAPVLWLWRQIVGQLSGAVPENLFPVPGTGDDSRFAHHLAITRHLRELAVRQTVLVVVEDLQWADDGSLRLLADVAALLDSAPVLLLATLRTGRPGDVLARTLARLARHGADRVTLRALTSTGVAAFARAQLGSGDKRAAEALFRRSGGNPFFLREILRQIADEGQAGFSHVPAAVVDVLRYQLSRLPKRTRQALDPAAVHGLHLDVGLLAEASDLGEEQLQDALDLAVLAGVLVESGTGLRFRYELVRRVIHADIPPLARSRWRRRLAAVRADRRAPRSSLAVPKKPPSDPR